MRFKSKKKYLLIGGYVLSEADKGSHYISARELARLYKLNPLECIFHEARFDRDFHDYRRKIVGYKFEELIILRPKQDGNYTDQN